MPAMRPPIDPLAASLSKNRSSTREDPIHSLRVRHSHPHGTLTRAAATTAVRVRARRVDLLTSGSRAGPPNTVRRRSSTQSYTKRGQQKHPHGAKKCRACRLKVRRNVTTARTSFISSLKQSLCGVRHHDELLVHDMEVADKSVATDDLMYAAEDYNTRLEVARLDAVLNTLVEQKVDAMKNGGSSRFIKAMAAASPNTIAKRLRIASLSTSIGDRDENSRHFKRKRRRHRLRQCSAERSFEEDGGHQRHGRDGGGGGRVSRSPESARCNLERVQLPLPVGAAVTTVPPPIAVLPPTTRTSTDEVYLQFDPASGSCCCVDHGASPDIRIPVSCDEDYVSLKIDEYEEDYEARRRRRKRRKRRRKRRKLRAMAAVAIVEEVRAIDPDELPPKARWTIMATAGLLLLMCLMLVGVTLRMAPLIDDMVRKENEALMYSLHGNKTLPTAATAPTL